MQMYHGSIWRCQRTNQSRTDIPARGVRLSHNYHSKTVCERIMRLAQHLAVLVRVRLRGYAEVVNLRAKRRHRAWLHARKERTYRKRRSHWHGYARRFGSCYRYLQAIRVMSRRAVPVFLNGDRSKPSLNGVRYWRAAHRTGPRGPEDVRRILLIRTTW